MIDFTKTILNALKVYINAKTSNIKKYVDDKTSDLKHYTSNRFTSMIPDWNQHDETADGYIKNRPFWAKEDVTVDVIIPEQSLTIEEDGGYMQIDANISQLTIGQTYHVMLNDIEYDCVARADGSTVLIGNGEIYGDGNISNGEPFSCDSYDNGNIYLNAALAGKYTFSMSIIEGKTIIKKIDEKYLPDGINDWNALKNRPFGEEMGQITLIEEQSIILDFYGDANLNHVDNFFDLIRDNNSYIVVFDGISYEATSQDTGDFFDINFTTNNGENVTISDGTYFTSNGLIGEHTIKVYSFCKVINKIDSKYLPDECVFKSELQDKISYQEIQYSDNNFNYRQSYAYGNGVFVALNNKQTNNTIKESNIYYYSNDAINWNISYLPIKQSWSDIIYANNMFIATGYSGAAYSVDGIEWTSCDCYGSSITYGNDVFVAVRGGYTSGEYAYYSNDGINWTKNETKVYSKSVAYGNGVFIAIDTSNNYSEIKKVYYSIDGINWERKDINIGGMWLDVAYGNGLFVMMGRYNKLVYSTDGINWINVDNVISGSFSNEDLCYANGLFYIGNKNDGCVAYSFDGANWTDNNEDNGKYYASNIVYGNNTYIASHDSRIVFSKDGLKWSNFLPVLMMDGKNITSEMSYLLGNPLTSGIHSTLATTDKTIVGAINEVNEKIDNVPVNDSGDSTFVVTVTGNDENGYASDKTFEEITEARNNNKNVIARLNSTGACYRLEYITSVNATFVAHKNAIDVQYITMNNLFGTLGISVHEESMAREESDMLTTEAKSIYAAINEVNEKIDNVSVNDSGDSTFVITVTGDDENGYVADKTYDEILEAYNNGQTCLMYHNVNVAGVLIIDTIYTLYQKTQNILKFRYTEVSNNGAASTMFQISSDNQVSVFDYQFTQTTFATKNTNSELNTTDKTLVGAINELNAKHTEGTDSLILLSPNGTRFSITVGDDGVLSATEITE